jgi:anti-sigma factor RsiW
MNLDLQLKIQAFIDRELPPQEALEVADRIAKDAQAKKLHDELRQIRALTVGTEIQRSAPCTPDFFWSQIEREIRSQTSRKARPAIELGWIWRLLAPASALLLMAILMLPQRHAVRSEIASASGSEVEAAIQGANIVTFRSDSEGVTVVWVDMD